MSRNKLLLLVLVLASFLRLAWLDSAPVSLSVDEVSYGYNAFSLLHSGLDQYRRPLPLIFEALGDYKLPVNMYLTVPSVAILGNSELAVRLPTAIFSILTIFLFYILVLQLTHNPRLALLCALILTVSPWHIRFSRGAYEASIALFFLLLSLIYFLKRNSPANLIFYFLTLMTYNSQRLFSPLLFISLSLLSRRYKLAAAFFALTLAPFILGHSTSRAAQILVTQDPVIRQTSSNLIFHPQAFQSLLIFWSISNRYLQYFDPSFLFSRGLGLTLSPLFDHGVLYLIELPLLIIGLRQFIKKPIFLLIFWMVLAPIPASLTLNDYHPIRSLQLVIVLSYLCALGLNWIFTNHHKIFYFFLIGYLGSLIIFADYYLVHLPTELSDQSFDPSRQVAAIALRESTHYSNIIIDPAFGKSAPNIIGTPDLYLLYFGHVLPQAYWNTKTSSGFANFSFRHIEWYVDQKLPDTLLIGSIWSLPESQIDPRLIITRINFKNGTPTYLAVSTSIQ